MDTEQLFRAKIIMNVAEPFIDELLELKGDAASADLIDVQHEIAKFNRGCGTLVKPRPACSICSDKGYVRYGHNREVDCECGAG